MQSFLKTQHFSLTFLLEISYYQIIMMYFFIITNFVILEYQRERADKKINS
jgi:hypothetical protein